MEEVLYDLYKRTLEDNVRDVDAVLRCLAKLTAILVEQGLISVPQMKDILKLEYVKEEKNG